MQFVLQIYKLKATTLLFTFEYLENGMSYQRDFLSSIVKIRRDTQLPGPRIGDDIPGNEGFDYIMGMLHFQHYNRTAPLRLLRGAHLPPALAQASNQVIGQ